ncbi:MAG: hypothetical protein Q9170_006718 [Blastenia crenularia]
MSLVESMLDGLATIAILWAMTVLSVMALATILLSCVKVAELVDDFSPIQHLEPGLTDFIAQCFWCFFEAIAVILLSKNPKVRTGLKKVGAILGDLARGLQVLQEELDAAQIKMQEYLQSFSIRIICAALAPGPASEDPESTISSGATVGQGIMSATPNISDNPGPTSQNYKSTHPSNLTAGQALESATSTAPTKRETTNNNHYFQTTGRHLDLTLFRMTKVVKSFAEAILATILGFRPLPSQSMVLNSFDFCIILTLLFAAAMAILLTAYICLWSFDSLASLLARYKIIEHLISVGVPEGFKPTTVRSAEQFASEDILIILMWFKSILFAIALIPVLMVYGVRLRLTESRKQERVSMGILRAYSEEAQEMIKLYRQSIIIRDPYAPFILYIFTIGCFVAFELGLRRGIYGSM